MRTAANQRPFFTGSVVGVGLGRFVFASAAFAVALSAPALAGPQGEKVVKGTAAFLRQGSVTTITAGNNAVINYSSFSIARHEMVRFIQPSASSRVLNRVTGPAATFIDGTLTSNGQVYIANPSGIFFGSHAVVNVGGLVAAAGTITNQDFLGGVDRFSGVKGTVENLGSIKASSVDMVGRYVANHGMIYAEQGTVTLSAGDEVFIGPRSGGMYVKVKTGPGTDQSGRAGVENTGTINARGGASLLTAGDCYSLAVRNTGTVRADRIKVEGTGSGVVAVGGTLDASNREAGRTGGTVQVLGGKVGLFDATIDASGDAGGGEVLIGGGFQGSGAVPTADRTYVSAGTEIRADAVTTGDGGMVVVWADDVTRFHGEISARGGAQSGDGGSAEVSGKHILEFRGRADLRAPAGGVGTLLLDPDDISIDQVIASSGISGTGTGGDPFTTGGANAVLDIDDLLAQLALSNVVVLTGHTVASTGEGDITVDTLIDHPGGGFSLSLRAHDDIILNANIDFTGTAANLHLQADFVGGNGDGAISGAGVIMMGTGGLELSAGSGIGSALAPIQTTGVTNLAAESDTGGIFLVNSGGGDINIATVGVTGVATGTSGSVLIRNDAGSITANEAVSSDGTLTLSAADGVTIDAATSAAGAIVINADNDGSGAGEFVVSNGTTVSTTVTPAAGSEIEVIAAAIDLNTSGSLSAGTGDIALRPSTAGAAMLIGDSGATPFELQDTELDNLTAGLVEIGAIGGTGAVTITSLDLNDAGEDYSLTVRGGQVDATDITLETGRSLTIVGSGPITLTDAIDVPNGTISVTSTNNSITTNAGATLTAIGGAGSITLRADDLTIGDDIQTGSITGTVSLVPNAGRTVSISATALQFDLSDAEIDFVQTNTLVIGASNSGAMVVDTLTPATPQFNNLTLISGSTIAEEGADDTVDVTVPNLLTLSAQGIGASGGALGAGTGPLDISAGTLSASAPGQSIFIKDDGGLTEADLTGNTVAIRSSGALVLGTVNAASLEAVAAGGNLTGLGGQQIAVSGAGAFHTLQANADITLTQLAVGGTISVNTVGATGDVDIVNTTGVDLAASTVGGDLDATATTGDVTDAGTVTAATARFTANAPTTGINLNQTTTTGAISFNTSGINGDVLYVRNGNIILGTSDVSENLALTANLGGSISDSGVATVKGNAAFTTTGGGGISLDLLDVDDVSSQIAVNTPGSATIVNSTNVRLAASAVGVTLDATATTGNLSDLGAVTAAAASFTTSATNGTITLDQTETTGAVSFNTSGLNGDVFYTRDGSINLGASDVGGDLTLTANLGGSIFDSGAAIVDGTASFITTGGGNIQVDVLDVDGVTGAIAVSTPGNAVVENDNAIRLGASNVGGTLLVTANLGSITDLGTITVGNVVLGGGLASFTTQELNADIQVNQLDVDVPDGAAISVNTLGPTGNALVRNSDGVDLAASNVGGLLTVEAPTLGITDSGQVTAGGLATFTTETSGQGILLDLANLGGPVSLNTIGAGGSARLENDVQITMAGSNVGGLLTLIADTGGVQFGTGAAQVISAGSLNVTSAPAGGISDVGRVSITGATSLDAGGADVTLNTATNDFGGLVTVTNATNVTVTDANALTVAALTIAGNLDLSAGGAGALTQTGAFQVAGTSALGGGAGGIVLTDILNDFQGEVRLATTGGGDATVTDQNTLLLGNGASNVTGDLRLDVLLGDLSQPAGTLGVTGTAIVNAPAALSVSLNQGNNFVGAVSVTGLPAGSGVILRDANQIVLGDIRAGALTVTANGIIDSGAPGDAVVVTGDTTLDATGGVITLDGPHDFAFAAVPTGKLNVLNGGDVTINDVNAITLGDMTADSLGVTAAAAINQTLLAADNIDVAGATTLEVLGAAAGITLANAQNRFGSVSVTDALSVALVDFNGLVLGTWGVSGPVSVIAGGAITGTSALTTGAATFTTLDNAGAGISLTNAGNLFGPLAVATRNALNTANAPGAITIVEGGAMNLASVRTAGAGSFTANGPITDSGTLTIGGLTQFTTLNPGADITLDQAVSSFGSIAADSAGDIDITENALMVLGLIDSAGGARFTSNTDVRVGSITAAGAVTIDAGGSINETGPAGDAFVDITADTLEMTSTGAIGATSAIEVAVGTEINATATSGGVALHALTGDLRIGQINAGAAGVVTLTADGGSIRESVNDAGADLTGAGLVVVASGEIGGAGRLETVVTTLSGTAPGGIAIVNSSGGTLSATLNGTSGDVFLRHNGAVATNGAWTGDAMTVVADDLDINNTVTAAGVLSVRRATPGEVTFGGPAGGSGLALDNTELAQIAAGDLLVGGDANTSLITVNGFTASLAEGIGGTTTLEAAASGGTIVFGATPSTFEGLIARAEAGITVDSDITTTSGPLELNGDTPGSPDTPGFINFAPGVRLNSAGALTLSSSTGGVNGAGDLTLSAAQGFTLSAGATLSTGGVLGIAAGDVDLAGSIANASGTVEIARSSPGSIDVGDDNGAPMVISGDELSRITSAVLRIGDRSSLGETLVSAITVDNVSGSHTAGILTQVFLAALAPGAGIAISGDASEFRGLSAAASGAIGVSAPITTTVNGMEFNTGGALTVDPALDTLVAQGGFTQTGGPVSLGASITGTNDFSLGGPVTLTDHVTLSTDSTVHLGSTVDSDAAGPRNLAVNGGVSLTGDVGGTRPLGAFSATGTTSIRADVEMTAGAATFGGDVRTEIGPAHGLTVTTLSGHAVFGGAIDLSGVPGGHDGGDLSVQSAGDISVAGDIDVSGGATTLDGRAGGTVSLQAPQGSISVAGIDASGADGVGGGAGGNAGNITLVADADLLTHAGGPIYLEPVGTIRLFGDLIADGGAGTGSGAAGIIEIAIAGRAATPGVGTILAYTYTPPGGSQAGSLQPVSVTISAVGAPGTGAVRFGANEKIVVTGDLTIGAGDVIRVGDITTGGNMTLTAPRLELYARAGADLLFPQGTVVNTVVTEVALDEGPDYVAGGTMRFLATTGIPVITIIGIMPADAVLGFAVGTTNGTTVPGFDPLHFPTNELILVYTTSAQSATILDLNARGSSILNVATSLAGAIPVFDVGEVTESTGLDAGQKTKVRDLGISPRDATEAENLQLLLGRALYNDFPPVPTSTDPARAAEQQFPVAVNRLSSDRVQDVLDKYDALFNKEVIDPATGQVGRVSNIEGMKQSLGAAVRRYREQPGAGRVDPAAFRQYLEQTPGEAEARDLVHNLGGFLDDMRLLGLGPREESKAFFDLLSKLRPQGITTTEAFRQVIQGGGA